MSSGTVPHGVPHGPPTGPPQQNITETDPLVKYQTLMPLLKESVMNLIKHTVHILQSTTTGTCRQADIQMLNKCMEDFYNISDQVYQWLALADSTVAQQQMASKFSKKIYPSFKSHARLQPQATLQQSPVQHEDDMLFYSQYLNQSKQQVAASEQLKNTLTDFADSLCSD